MEKKEEKTGWPNPVRRGKRGGWERNGVQMTSPLPAEEKNYPTLAGGRGDKDIQKAGGGAEFGFLKELKRGGGGRMGPSRGKKHARKESFVRQGSLKKTRP